MAGAQHLRPAGRTSRDDRLLAVVATLCLHAVFFGLMYVAGEFIDPTATRAAPIEVEIISPPPEPRPKKVETKPEEKVEAKPEEKVETKPEKKVRPKVAQTVPKAAAPADDPPAAGPNTNDDAPAPVVTLPSLGTQGSGPPVAVGRPKTRYVGTGGTGTNTGGGGADDARGTGAPRPVSIAAIKQRARPLNPDLDTSKLYPDEARRLGIEGQVKVFLVIDESGLVTRRRVTKSLGHGLDEVALELAKKLRFEPAIDTQGRPVSDKLEWTFTFVLPR